ncbi:MAG: hypothetical protein LBL48_09315 [Azoarcus sp.]|nr:hypothetical protein [Azoarcus sp.]
MKVTTLILNADGEPHFFGEDHLDTENLFVVAKSREPTARVKGAEWTAGLMSFFGSEVVKAVNFGEHDDVGEAIANLCMAAWLFDSMYCGVRSDQYLESDMKFTISHAGAVVHTRVPAGEG